MGIASLRSLSFIDSTALVAMDLTPPPGGDENKGPVVLAAVWTLTSIALVTVAARLYGRYRLTRNAGWDDLFITISMVSGSS